MGTITHKVMQTLGDKKVAMNKGLDVVEDEETGRDLTLEECDDLELLNNIAFPSITGFDAKAPKLPIPKIAEPLLITATKFPLLV